MEKTYAWLQQNQTRLLDVIKELLKIPSISAEPQFKSDVLKAKDWIVQKFKDANLEVQTFETPGFPVIYAQSVQDNSKKTVLIYSHYDVQPAGDASLWKFKPFEPTEEEGKLYGRGTVDDKMQGLIHFSAYKALLEAGDELPVNFKFLLEGEEEVSSPHIMDVVKAHKDMMKCDYIIISDGVMLSSDQPSIEVGARGIIYTQIKLSTGNKDLHSGLFGGVVKNANFELTKLLSKLKDEKNKITLPDFYRDVVLPTEAEKDSWQNLPVGEAEILQDSEVFSLDRGEEGYSLWERNWARPTAEVNGIWGGFTGDGAKTVIPNEAYAKVSFRLVPDQKPSEILKSFENWLNTNTPEGVKIEIQWSEMAPPFLAQPSDKAFALAQDAYAEVFGNKALLTRTGGTVGLLTGLKEVLNVPILMLNFGCNDENMHAPNEFMRMENFYRGIKVSLKFLNKLRSL